MTISSKQNYNLSIILIENCIAQMSITHKLTNISNNLVIFASPKSYLVKLKFRKYNAISILHTAST